MRKRSAWAVLLLSCRFAAAASAQVPDAVRLEGTCKGQGVEGREIRNIHISTPFDLLHLKFLRDKIDSIKLPLQSKTAYRDSDVNAAIQALDSLTMAPPLNFGLPISGSVTSLRLGCSEENGRPVVDLDFYYFPAQVPTLWPSTRESKTEDTTDAAHSSGAAPRRFWLTPTVAYSNSARLVVGASMLVERQKTGDAPQASPRKESFLRSIDSFSIDAGASSQVQFFSAAITNNYLPYRQPTLEQSKLSRPWIRKAGFRAGVTYRDEPIGDNRVKAGTGFLEWKANSNTFGKGGMIIRYGMAFDGGFRRASGPTEMAADDSRVLNLKGFAGTTFRNRHHTFSASYGIAASHSGTGGVFSYSKQLVDVSHGLSFSPNYFPIEFDTHVSAGRIDTHCGTGCAIPLADRFFGGNVERNFLSDQSWIIRSQPLLRSLPLNGLDTSAAGAGRGGDRFLAMNVTAGFGIARMPLIPSDLRNEPGFLQRIDNTPKTVTELLASAYAATDKAFLTDPGIQMAVANLVPMIEAEFTLAQKEWDQLAASLPTTNEEVSICSDDHLAQVPLDIDDINMKVKPITLLSNNSSSLAKSAKCFRQFSRGPADPLIASADRLDELRKSINTAVASTQVFVRARMQAERDMVLADRTVHTLFHQTNLISFSPVVALDAAAIGPHISGAPSLRYGVGGGGRVTILSTLRLTLGYSANVNRQPNEGPGAIFASMEVLDIWGR